MSNHADQKAKKGTGASPAPTRPNRVKDFIEAVKGYAAPPVQVKMATGKTARKVHAATAGAAGGLGAGEATILILEQLFSVDVPGALEALVVAIVGALLTRIAGRQARPHPQDEIVPEGDSDLPGSGFPPSSLKTNR